MSALHGYTGYMSIDGVRALCRPGARLSMPRNLDIPYPIDMGFGGAVNYAEGLKYPVIQAPLIPMENTTPWFTAANLNAWFNTRAAAPTRDLGELANDLLFSDNGISSGTGLGTFKVVKVKGAGYTLNFRKGSPIGFNVRFAGRTRQTTSTGLPTAGLDGTPLNFARIAFGGALANVGIAGATLSFDTGLTPNPELDGTVFPKEHNADIPNASLSLELNARADVDAPGFDSANLDTYPEVTGVIGIQRVSSTPGPAVWVYFTITRAVPRDPDDRTQQQGRIMRPFTYDLFASAAGSQPVLISEAAVAPP
jgi:opacity protein-like surface antigen